MKWQSDKKGGLDNFAGFTLYVSGKVDLSLCGFMWKRGEEIRAVDY
jgi:hypothetical protein